MTASSLSFAHPGVRQRMRASVRRILTAASLVALLDGLYVVVVFAGLLHVTTPAKIFKGIARAVIGPAAATGGFGTAMLGVALHCAVALTWSIVWALAFESSAALRRLTATTRSALGVGVAYGTCVWAGMRYLVLPLTQAPPGPLMTRGTLLVLLAHILVVGPPIVLAMRRADTSP
jgi:hypothetical protein